MPRMAGCTRLLSKLPGVLALAMLVLFVGAAAHTGLKRSEPAKGSRLLASPSRISLWFTARPQLALSRIRLTGPAGGVALDPLVADTGNSLRARVPRALGPGEYRVQWQTSSADGHPIRGEFSFLVVGAQTPAALSTAVKPDDSAHAGHEEPNQASSSAPSEYRTARWFEFVALLTVLGALGFRHGVLPPLAARGVPTADAADRARRLGQSVLVLYAIAAVVRLYTESVALHGAEEALGTGVLIPLLTSTTWGIGWVIGVVGAVLVSIGWAVSKRTVIGTPLALTGALGMVLSPALSGHAASSRHFVLSVTLDMLHVAAAGVWLGGLLMLLFAGIPAMRRLANGNQDAAVSALVNSFHPLGLFCAPIVVVAGFGTSWIRLGAFGASWSTPYGRTLLIKIALFVLVVGMGTYHALRSRRRLGAPDGTRRFRMTGAIELLFAALVLAVTTFLVGTPVPSEMVAPP